MSEVVELNTRSIGNCPVCRRSVLFGDNFIRLGGFVLHLRCALENHAVRAKPGHKV